MGEYFVIVNLEEGKACDIASEEKGKADTELKSFPKDSSARVEEVDVQYSDGTFGKRFGIVRDI